MLIVYRIVRLLKADHFASVCAALLFGLHPIQVEAVAWVSGLKDVLSGLFFMLTLLMYAQYVEKSKVQSPRFGMD